jgi:hypothetical protein
MLKISDRTKNQGAIGLNQTLDKEAGFTTINNKTITSPSNNISQLKSSGENNTNSGVGIKTLDNELPFQLKSGIEQLSGISMGEVKVHHNSDKPAQFQAHAYAQGTDIHLAKGQEKHLPHEAWHVVQQKQGRVKPTTQFKTGVPINDDLGLEKEADVMGARALQMKPFSLSDYRTEKSVQKKGIVQKVGEKKPFEYPEGEKPERNVSSLLDFHEKKGKDEPILAEFDEMFSDKADPSAFIVENPYEKGEDEELSSNQKIEDITTVIIALSKNIKKFKAKKEEEAKKAEAQEILNRAEEAAKEAAKEAGLQAAAVAKSKEAAKEAGLQAAAVANAKEAAKEAGLQAAAVANAKEAARIATEAEAARIATENATLLAINVAAEKAEEARTLVDNCIGENSTVVIASQAASFPAKTVGEVGVITGKESLVESASKGAAVGFIADLVEAFSAVTSYYNSEKKPADLTILGLNVGKFVTAVVDGVNTATDNALVGEALSTSIGLLPGIGASLMAFKNSVQIYQTIIKIDKIKELSTLKDDSDKSPFTLKEIELIEQYKTDLDDSLNKIKVDFILNVTKALCMLYPPAAIAVTGLHVALGLYQFASRNYSSYLNNKERKRAERIGEIDVDELKSDRMDKKSENVSFKSAVADLYILKRLKNKVPQDADKIREAQEKHDKNLREINNERLVYAGSNSLITEENLEDFLNVEAEVIKNIAAELKKEEAFKKRFYLSFRLPQKKDQIYREMKLIPLFNFEGITSEDIHKLSPEMNNYFYDKTQEAIKVACNRQHISATERLDKIETSLLTKQNNAVINSYMLEMYEGQKVYEATDTPKEKFTKAVKRYKFELKKI